MPLIYISPYYSMLDYSLALEGVAGFRHYDRYGNDQAIDTKLKAYDPAIVDVGYATNTIDFITALYTTVDGGISISCNYPGNMHIFPSTLGGGLDTDFNFNGRYYDSISSSLAIQPHAVNFPVVSQGTNTVSVYSWYGSYDGGLATATLSPSWVDSSQFASGDAVRISRNLSEDSVESNKIYMPYQGYGFPTPLVEGSIFYQIPPAKETVSRPDYYLYDGGNVRATGVKAFPPTLAITANEVNSKMNYYLYDSSLARATPSPSFAAPNELGAADTIQSYVDPAEDKASIENIKQLYVQNITTYKNASGVIFDGTAHDVQQALSYYHMMGTDTTVSYLGPNYMPVLNVDIYGFEANKITRTTYEDSIDISNLQIDYLPTLSSSRESFITNSFEGTTLNNGTLTTGTGSWVSYYCNTVPSQQTGSIYFEFVSGGGSIMYGFIGATRNSPNNGSYFMWNGGWCYPGNALAVNNNSVQEWTYYINNFESPTSGWVYGCSYNYTSGEMKFYRNGQLQMTCFGQPGVALKPAISTSNSNCTFRFNKSSWSYNPEKIGVVRGAVSGLAIGITSHATVEDRTDIRTISQLYVPTMSTLYAPVKTRTFGAWENTTLQNGTLTSTSSTGNWYANWGASAVSTGLFYYEMVPVGTPSSTIFGVTCGNGYPRNGSNSLTNYDPGTSSGNWAQPGTVAASTSNYDFCIYPDVFQVIRSGEVYSVLLDTVENTLKFFRNGSLIITYTGMPYGKYWRPCVSAVNCNYTMRFNVASWTYASTIGITNGDASPGGTVTGLATNIGKSMLVESAVDVSDIIFSFANQTPVTVISSGCIVDKNNPKFITGKITPNDSSYAIIAILNVGISSAADWGNALSVGVEGNIGNTKNNNPYDEQITINKIWDANETATISDYWGQNPVPSKTQVGEITFTHFSHTTNFIQNNIARTYNKTTQLECKGAFEQVAAVNTAERVIYWNYDYETTLYPLSTINTGGLSNTTNSSTV